MGSRATLSFVVRGAFAIFDRQGLIELGRSISATLPIPVNSLGRIENQAANPLVRES